MFPQNIHFLVLGQNLDLNLTLPPTLKYKQTNTKGTRQLISQVQTGHYHKDGTGHTCIEKTLPKKNTKGGHLYRPDLNSMPSPKAVPKDRCQELVGTKNICRCAIWA